MRMATWQHARVPVGTETSRQLSGFLSSHEGRVASFNVRSYLSVFFCLRSVAFEKGDSTVHTYLTTQTQFAAARSGVGDLLLSLTHYYIGQ